DVSGLVDSDGNATGVGFKTSAHDAYGDANFGPSDLLNDYLLWDRSQNPLQWELNGLEPGSTYALFLNGASQPSRFLMTVDTNGDGSLADETAVEVVSPPGAFFASVVANADGKILGTGTRISDDDDADWGGFQLAGPLGVCPAIAASVSGD